MSAQYQNRLRHEKETIISQLPLKPSMQSECTGKTLDLPARHSFRECVSDHVVSGTVDDVERAVFNGLANEVVPDVDVLHLRVEIVGCC